MNRRTLSITAALFLLPLSGCVSHQKPAIASTETASVEFERFYAAWHQECEAIRYSSNTHDYIELPDYRKMVLMGRPALPLLEKKLSEDRADDFMLADAVVEICGWDRRDFSSKSEQEFRDDVLKKLKASQ